MEITGFKDHEQSRLIQHSNTIESLRETLDTIMKEETPDPEQVKEYKVKINNEEEQLRQFVAELKEGQDTNTWVDSIMEVIETIESYVQYLPEDIQKVVKPIIEQVKKALILIKTLGD